MGGIMTVMIPKNAPLILERVLEEAEHPIKWYFADHRIPFQLKMIEKEGKCTIPTFFKIVAKRWIPNFYDLNHYYWNWGKWAVNGW